MPLSHTLHASPLAHGPATERAGMKPSVHQHTKESSPRAPPAPATPFVISSRQPYRFVVVVSSHVAALSYHLVLYHYYNCIQELTCSCSCCCCEKTTRDGSHALHIERTIAPHGRHVVAVRRHGTALFIDNFSLLHSLSGTHFAFAHAFRKHSSLLHSLSSHVFSSSLISSSRPLSHHARAPSLGLGQ